MPGEDSRCVICYTEVADIVIMPCQHLIVCEVRNVSGGLRYDVVGQRLNYRLIEGQACCGKMEEDSAQRRCPVCREEIVDWVCSISIET